MPERWRACPDPDCPELISNSHPCPRGHGRQPVTGWAPRDQAAHMRFARAVKRRDKHACVICGATEDVRAAHIVPLHRGGSDDPSNGRTLCAYHDKQTDRHAG